MLLHNERSIGLINWLDIYNQSRYQEISEESEEPINIKTESDLVVYHILHDSRMDKVKFDLKTIVGQLADRLLIIVLDNRIGISNWIERRTDLIDSTDHVMIARESDADSIGLSISELEGVIRDLEYESRKFYPYPNSCIVKDIYTDEYMPKTGFNFGNTPDYIHERIQLMDQSDATDVLLEEGLLDFFFDSVMFVVGKKLTDQVNTINYIHFSTNRNERFKTITTVSKDSKREVLKKPYTASAEEFVDSIFENYNKLTDLYKGTRVSFNKAEKNGHGISLEFVEGKSLSEYLDEVLADSPKKCIEAMGAFFEELKRGQKTSLFKVTPDFENVFGDVNIDFGETLGVSNIDCIFDNVFLREFNNLRYEIVDYEWTFDFPIPFEYIIYRCIHYYMAYRKVREESLEEKVWDYFDITSLKREKFAFMEKGFQNYVFSVSKQKEELSKQKTNWLLKNIYDEYKFCRTLESRLDVRKKQIQPEISYTDLSGKRKSVEQYSVIKEGYYNKLSFEVPADIDEVVFRPATRLGIYSQREVKDEQGRAIKHKLFGYQRIDKKRFLAVEDRAQILLCVKKVKKVSIIYRYDYLVSDNEYVNIPPEELSHIEETQIRLAFGEK